MPAKDPPTLGSNHRDSWRVGLHSPSPKYYRSPQLRLTAIAAAAAVLSRPSAAVAKHNHQVLFSGNNTIPCAGRRGGGGARVVADLRKLGGCSALFGDGVLPRESGCCGHSG